jgi:hypothetical protein
MCLKKLYEGVPKTEYPPLVLLEKNEALQFSCENSPSSRTPLKFIQNRILIGDLQIRPGQSTRAARLFQIRDAVAM